MKKESIVFYRSFFDAIRNLPPEDYKKCMDAILYYSFDDIEPDANSGMAYLVFTMAKPQIDVSIKRYNACVENGKKGGNPNFKKGEKNPYYNNQKDNQKITKTLPKDNQLDNQKDNLNYNYNENYNLNYNENYNDNNSSNKITTCGKFLPKKDNSPLKLFLTLPLIDKTEYAIYEEDLEKWRELYPAADIEQEFRNMKGWCNTHEKNRKTKRGIGAFINNWLNKAQNSASSTNTRGTPISLKNEPKTSDLEHVKNDKPIDSEDFIEFLNNM